MAQFPLIKGRKTSKDSRYLDALPVNMIPIPAEAPNAQGYLRSFKGINHLYDCDGISMSIDYNDLTGNEYRILGKKLYKDGSEVATLVDPHLANMDHSRYSQAFVDNGKLKYFRDDKVTELKNWSEGENYVSYPKWKFTPKSGDGNYIQIPKWTNSSGFVIKFNVYLSSLPSTDSFLLSSEKDSNDNFSGVWYKGSDNSFYYRLKDPTQDVTNVDVKIQTAVIGENSIAISTESKFQRNIEFVKCTKKGGALSEFFPGQMYNLSMYDVGNLAIYRTYPMIEEVERKDGKKPEASTTKEIVNTQDKTGATNGTLNGYWVDYHKQSEPVKSPPTQYDVSGVIDVCRHQGRYVWINKQRFGCTALTIGASGDRNTSPEQRPDYTAPLYSPESDPDNNKAVRTYLGNYVVVFGRNTTEFFRLTGDASNLFIPQKGMETQAGIVATPSVCHYMGAFAGIGSAKGESLGVILIEPNRHRKISTATIDGVLSKYKESELQESVVESVTMDNHNLLFVHLPNECFVFDGAQNAWFMLKSDVVGGTPYTGRHVMYNHKLGLTIGDKNKGRVGELTDDVASQYGEFVEHLLYTPFVKVNPRRGKVRLFDLSFDSIYGHSSQTQSIMISATEDGRIFGNEMYVEFNKPIVYANKTLISNLGSVEDSIGFKLRLVTKDNVALSGFNVRIENV